MTDLNKLLLEALNDEIVFNIKLQALVAKRNKAVVRALRKMEKTIKEVK